MKNKLYILCGIPFSGKSTLAKIMVEKLGYTRIDLDEIKFEIFGKNIIDSEIDQSGWDKIYKKMYGKIREKLLGGETVVYDTGNFTKDERDLVKEIADKLGIESITILVDTSEIEARRRLRENRKIKTRFDVDDVDFQNTVKEMEKPDDTEKHLVFNPTDLIDEWIEINFKK